MAALAAVGIVLGALGAGFLAVIAGTLMGGVVGWLIGLVFSPEILGILGKLGVHDVTMWQFGLFMGFLGGFLRSHLTTKSD